MNEASLKWSKTLSDLSGWIDPDGGLWGPDGIEEYTLGYLIRKLPEVILQSNWKLPPAMNGERFHDDELLWKATHYKVKNIVSIDAYADTPEGAVAKLAIHLIKKGLIDVGEK